MDYLIQRIKRYHGTGIPYAIPFICAACAKGNHLECRGETWCDCQHRSKESKSND